MNQENAFFSEKKMYSLLGKSHIDIYGWDGSKRDVIHKQNHHVIVERFPINFFMFLIYKTLTEIFANHHKTSLSKTQQDTGL